MKASTNFQRYLAGGLLFVLLPLFIIWQADPVSGSAPSPKEVPQKKQSPDVVPGVVVIKLKGGSLLPSGALLKASGRMAQLLRTYGVTSVQKSFPASRALAAKEENLGKVDVSLIYFGRINPGLNPVEVARQLDKSGEFEYVEPKYMSHIFDTPNDLNFAANQLTYFTRMNALSGWAIAKGDSNVVIADVDGGTFWQHPDLIPNLWINPAEDANHDRKFEPTSTASGGDDNGVDDDLNGFIDDVIGWNFANNSNDPTGLGSTPFNASHGTATASHFGAATNNGIGMAGSSWNCRLMPINTSAPASDDNIEFGFEGIQYAYANGAKVINCSWGHTGTASRFEQDIIDAATQAGALVVAAAGNDNNLSDLLPQYPANYRNVLAVGATNSANDLKASFSNYGLTVPVYAPGVGIWGALTNGSYGNVGDGTSYASPLTAGLAGLVKSLHPTWTPKQIATQIRMTSDSVGPIMGHGRVNFARALSESHAGIEIVSSTLLTTFGDKVFLPGDTVVLNLKTRNVMLMDAQNLTFVATSSDPVLQPLQVATGTMTLVAGDSAALPPFLFKVGSLSVSRAVLIRLDWTSNSNEHDAYAFRVDVFPAAPSWENIQSSTFLPLFSVAGIDKKTAWAAGGNTQATAPVVVRTVDSGVTWNDATANLVGADLYCVSAIDSSHAWVGTGDGRIFATTNGGTSWTAQPYPGTQSPFIDGIKIFPNLTGYALGDPASGGRFVVLKTTDGGLNWAHLANEPVGSATEAGWNNSFWWTDLSHGWFGTNNNRIWRTTDGGTTWSSGATAAQSSVGVSFGDNTHGLAGFSDGSISSTTDGGATWFGVASPIAPGLGVVGISYAPGTQYAWVADAGFPYVTRNGGGSWIMQSTWPVAGSIVHLSMVDTTTGWLVSSFGEALRYRGEVATSTGHQNPDLPVDFSLAQNYPNPFNPSTTIRFKIPYRSNVKLTIYNVLGQQIAELVNREFQAGTHEEVWQGGFASGIYFYRIEAAATDNSGKRFVDVKKMVLLK